jgi:dolichyl-phosphate-mannose-protein mannosyltransferase
MRLFGFTSWSWRISSALFGIGVIGMVFAVGKKLRLPAPVALMAAFLAACDGLLLTMSRVTMNDIHVTFFYLLTTYLYLGWKEKPALRPALLTGLSAGLTLSSKWSGIFVVGLIVGDILWAQSTAAKKIALKPFLQLAALILFLVPTIYLLSYSQMWLQGKEWEHFAQLHEQIWWYQNNLDATHPYQSTPLQWVFSLRPVYAYTENAGPGFLQNIYFQANPLLLWIGALAIAFGVGSLFAKGAVWIDASQRLWNVEAKRIESLRSQLKEKITQQTEHHSALLFLLLAYFSTWIVWLQSPRIMFFYHYTPAIPFLCLILALQLWSLRTKAGWLIPLVLLSIFFIFLLLYPNLTALPVPEEPWHSLFFALKSWR